MKNLAAVSILVLTSVFLTQAKAQNMAFQLAMGEIVAESAAGASAGATFVAAVSGQSTENIMAVASGSINGFAQGVAETAEAVGISMTNLVNTIQAASQGGADLEEVSEAVISLAQQSGVPADELVENVEAYRRGEVTKETLAQVIQETTSGLIPADGPIQGMLTQLVQTNPNRAIMADFATQITDIVQPLIPRVDLLVAMAIQGAIRGVLEGAEDAGLNAGQIAQIQTATQNISPAVTSTLGSINLADVLSFAPIDTLLAQSLEGPPLVDLDDPLLTEIAFEDIIEPILTDRDKDGLFDIDEQFRGTDPENPDSDGDLLKDGAEVFMHSSDPTVNDTDGDGVSDSIEVGIGENPALATTYGPDTDGDGIPDFYETTLVGTNPNHPDTDGDGWTDGFEIGVGYGVLTSDANNPLVKNVRIDATGYTVSPIGETVQTWLVGQEMTTPGG